MLTQPDLKPQLWGAMQQHRAHVTLQVGPLLCCFQPFWSANHGRVSDLSLLSMCIAVPSSQSSEIR